MSTDSIVSNLWNRYVSALKHSEFRRYWYGASIAAAGVWGLIVARGALAYQISDQSSTAVGLTTFAALIPFVIVPPFSGIMADRFDRKKLVAIGHGSNIIFALMLAIIYYFYTTELWHLVALSLFSGIARGFQLPAQIALVPNLVPKTDLLNAIALSNLSLQGSRFFGSILVTGIMLTSWGVGAAFVVAVFLYTIATFLVLSLKTESRGIIDTRISFLETVSAGLVYAYKNPGVGLMLVLIGFHCSLTMSFESVFPAHVTDVFGIGLSGYSSIISFFGAGAVVGVISIAAIRSDVTKGRLLMLTGLGSSSGVLLLALSPSIIYGLGAAFLMGLTQAPFMSLSMTYIQSVVPDNIRGRVGSLFTISALSLMAISNLTLGNLADTYGSEIVLIVPGLIFLLIIILVILFIPTMNKIFFKGFPKLTV